MLTIGKVAALADTTVDALRYYEREGLMTPAAKSETGYRLYEPDAVRRVRFIKHAQQCGFSLNEIRDLLILREREAACCGDIRKLAIEKQLKLQAKIKAMQVMSDALGHLIAACSGDAGSLDDCPILAALDKANGTHTPKP